MNKEFIPYEEALALKELGFDEPCFYVKLISNPEFFYTPTDYDDYPKQKEKEVLIPTYSQAFRWFRKKYNLHNGIYPYYDEYEFQIKDFRLPTNTPINGGLMKYEEAELACFKKLIEIVKNGK
jgi:hypothetical protein